MSDAYFFGWRGPYRSVDCFLTLASNAEGRLCAGDRIPPADGRTIPDR